MELRNLSTGGVFGCSDESLLAEGGYEKVGAETAPPRKAPARRAPAKKTAE